MIRFGHIHNNNKKKKLGNREIEQQFNYDRERKGDEMKVWVRANFLCVYTGLDLLLFLWWYY